MKEENQTPRIISIIAIGILLVAMSTCRSRGSEAPLPIIGSTGMR